MKFQLLKYLSILFITVFLLYSCQNENDGDNDDDEQKISTYFDNDSHNAGQNCMNCHVSGGSGEGNFIAAGTVYDNLKTSIYPNATVKLYSEPNGTGTLKHTIEVDGLGNFYTTSFIDFSNGLYVSVEGNSEIKHMASPITSGQCNSCHGSSTDKIWTN